MGIYSYMSKVIKIYVRKGIINLSIVVIFGEWVKVMGWRGEFCDSCKVLFF